jgi:hypothetical protein
LKVSGIDTGLLINFNAFVDMGTPYFMIKNHK